MSPKLSVFIITRNAGSKLEACLAALRWANEVIIVDSQSTDRTVDIAHKTGAKVQDRDFQNFADQKNYAMNLCSGEWLLSIDSDEVVTDELKKEMLATLDAPVACAAYRIPRRSVIFGREFRFSGTQNDKPIRLFKKGCGKFENPIHESLVIQGRVGELKSPMMHFTYDSLSDYFTRFNRYTTLEAEFLLKKMHNLSFGDFSLRPLAMFLKLYIFKQGFRDGWEGFLFCLFSSWYVFVKYAKYRELLRKRTDSDRHS